MTQFGKRSFRAWPGAGVAFVIGLLLPSVLWAQGVIDNPTPGSVQSGAGLITGWTCEAEEVLVFIDELPPIVAAYGTTRADTAVVCGDDDNGYGLTFNWNLVGDGLHRVRVEVDGVELGRVAFLVSTLGLGEFPTGLSGKAMVVDFPDIGSEVEIEWQQSQQNFVLSADSAAGGGSGGAPPAVLDSPQAGSFQSGIGLIFGWVCAVADEVLIFIDDLPPLRAAYGTTRADTVGECLDDDNGYGLTFNWNLVGPGTHTVRATADGAEFANVTFTVTTTGLEEEFPQGLEDLTTALGTIFDFPQAETDVRVRWQDSQQNFLLEGIIPPGRDPSLCTTQEGQVVDPNGAIANFVFTNLCTLNGEGARIDVTVPVQSALQGNALLGRAKADGFELCSDLLIFMQDGNEIPASDLAFVDGQGDEVCRTLAPGETFRTLIAIPPGNSLDFSRPFQPQYNGEPVVDFSGTPQFGITITEPVNGAKITQELVTVAGRITPIPDPATAPALQTVQIHVNGILQATVDIDDTGRFRAPVSLDRKTTANVLSLLQTSAVDLTTCGCRNEPVALLNGARGDQVSHLISVTAGDLLSPSGLVQGEVSVVEAVQAQRVEVAWEQVSGQPCTLPTRLETISVSPVGPGEMVTVGHVVCGLSFAPYSCQADAKVTVQTSVGDVNAPVDMRWTIDISSTGNNTCLDSAAQNCPIPTL
jgi:hypothetical protein